MALSADDDDSTFPDRVQPDELPSGRLLGDWIVERRVNRGGFATIYLARHADDDRQAAIKVLHAQLVQSQAILSRFHREAATINELRHPNIVETYGVGLFDDGRPYIVMEWLEGRDLHQEVEARGPFSPADTMAVMEALVPALALAHARGVVHRDLKLHNVMLLPPDPKLRVKLVDFGVAKLLDPSLLGEGLTRTGEVVGTVSSMAPEQIRNRDVDGRTDIYALGLMLYKLLTGRNAFDGESAAEVQDKHLHAPPPRPSEHAAVGAAVDEVVARCMEKERAARYPDVEAFLAALRAAFGPLRPPAAGVALYLEARVGEEASDEELDELERWLERVRTAARAERMTIVADSGTSLLAVRELDSDARGGRQATVTWARALARDVTPAFDVTMVLHTAPLRSLAQASEWAAGRPDAGLYATAAMVEGLTERDEEGDAITEPAGPKGVGAGRFIRLA